MPISFILPLFLAILLSAGGKPAQTRSFVIIYTHNTNGILENCGCPGNPMGGVDKRLTVMQRISDEHPGRTLRVDGGDLLSAIGFKDKDTYVVRAYTRLDTMQSGLAIRSFQTVRIFLNT